MAAGNIGRGLVVLPWFLGLNVAALTAYAQADPVEVGGRLGQMTGQAVLGVVCVALVIGIVRLFSLKEQASQQHHQERDKYIEQHATLVQNVAAAIQHGADASEQVAGLMVEVKDALRAAGEASRSVVKSIEMCERNREGGR